MAARLYFCISSHKKAPLSTPETPCLAYTKALVHLVGCRIQDSKKKRCKKATLMVEAAWLVDMQSLCGGGSSAAPAEIVTV